MLNAIYFASLFKESKSMGFALVQTICGDFFVERKWGFLPIASEVQSKKSKFGQETGDKCPNL